MKLNLLLKSKKENFIILVTINHSECKQILFKQEKLKFKERSSILK